MFGIFIATLILGTLLTSVYLAVSYVTANRAKTLQLVNSGEYAWVEHGTDYAICLNIIREQRAWSKRILFDLKRIFA